MLKCTPECRKFAKKAIIASSCHDSLQFILSVNKIECRKFAKKAIFASSCHNSASIPFISEQDWVHTISSARAEWCRTHSIQNASGFPFVYSTHGPLIRFSYLGVRCHLIHRMPYTALASPAHSKKYLSAKPSSHLHSDAPYHLSIQAIRFRPVAYKDENIP